MVCMVGMMCEALSSTLMKYGEHFLIYPSVKLFVLCAQKTVKEGITHTTIDPDKKFFMNVKL